MRGKYPKRGNQIPPNIILQIKNHINSFPRCVSHYSRNDNREKQYLSPELSVKKMYRMYLEKYENDFLERKSRGEQINLLLNMTLIHNISTPILIYHLLRPSQIPVKHAIGYKI